LYSQNVTSNAGNQIITGGGNLTVFPSTTVTMQYSGLDNAWIVVSASNGSYSSGSSGYWTISGNTGAPTGSFLGTADSQDLVFKTNNTERMRIYGNAGTVGINASPDATGLNYQLNVGGNVNLSSNNAYCITLTGRGNVSAGDVVGVSGSNDNGVLDAIGTNVNNVIGVAVTPGSILSNISVAVAGAVQVTVSTAVTRGQFAIQSSTAGQATFDPSGPTLSDFGIFLSTQSTPGQKAWVLLRH